MVSNPPAHTWSIKLEMGTGSMPALIWEPAGHPVPAPGSLTSYASSVLHETWQHITAGQTNTRLTQSPP